MASIRLNSEKKIDSKNFRLKIGTTDKTNPQVIYVEGRTFISPKQEKDSYSQDISEIKHVFSHAISDSIHTIPNFDGKFIMDFQVASNGISINKKSFLSFQFLLRQKKDNMQKLSDIKSNNIDFIYKIISILEKSIENHDFIISKTKKTLE